MGLKMSTCERTREQRFNGENYHIWASRVRMALQRERQWEAVDPGYAAIPDDQLTAVQKSRDAAALNFIMETVEDSFVPDIEECTRAAQAWAALAEIHCTHSWLAIVTMMKELGETKKTPDMTMNDYIHKIGMLVNKLKKSGIPMADQLHAAYLLSGLPQDRHEALCNALDEKNEELTVKMVKSKLFLGEKREKLDKVKSEPPEESPFQAFAVRQHAQSSFRGQRGGYRGGQRGRGGGSYNRPPNNGA